MIKQIRFLTRKPGMSRDAFLTASRAALVSIAELPREDKPRRGAFCTVLPDVDGSSVTLDAIVLEWFRDAEHLDRFHAWLDAGDGRDLARETGEMLDKAASPLVVADELVLRGTEWLAQRWRDGGEKLKHMALARRARDLTLAEFSQRWRRRAGQVARAGERTTTAIPDEARGLAYVQNHARPRSVGEWAYDAVNEVYFDDLASLQQRVDWFRENLLEGGDDDLVSEHWFVVAREEVLYDAA